MPGKKGQNFVPVFIRFIRAIKVNPIDGCWDWQLSRDDKGYGSFTYNGKHSRAHRFAYEHYIGELEPDMKVCHKCDHPWCSNPFHLFKGTDYDNVMDAIDKGRRPKAQHGTISMYCNDNCRCEQCVKAGYEYFKSVRLRKNPNAGQGRQIPHGSQWAYAKYKCRCESCIEAHEINLAKRKERRKKKP